MIAMNFLWYATVNASDVRYDSWSDWNVYHGDRSGSHYSDLQMIDRENVRSLELAWTFEGDPISGRSTIQCNPLIVNGKVFLTTQRLRLVCLNGESGEKIWTWNPADHGGGGGVSRGMTMWQAENSAQHSQRLLYVSGSYLFCLDPTNGNLMSSFGDGGRVDLRHGLDRELLGESVTANTPGIIYKDLIILGSRVGEGPGPSAPGHVRAFNVMTGAREWIFHTIPQPGELGYETWPADAWLTMGGANAWGGMTLDASRGTVFFGTGSASYDHYGGNRKGANLFANCILSLDAATGEYRWHFQTVHHDLWDYDLPCPPVLTQVKHQGVWKDAAVQVTKTGHVFVMDRDSGTPLFPVEEIPVPQSEVPGEHSWPTQPIPVIPPPFAHQRFTSAEVARIDPETTAETLEQLKDMVTGDVFTPPGFKRSVVLPQFNGGAEWGGAACDPMTQTLYINASNEAEWISMKPSRPVSTVTSFAAGKGLYKTVCANCHGNTSVAGNFQNPPASLMDVSKRLTRPEVMRIMMEGRGGMPSFAAMDQIELEAITDFLFQTGKSKMLDPESFKSKWQEEIPYVATGHHEWRDKNGFPVNKRPWGTLTAIDLNSGSFKWQIPLGTYPQLEKRGFPPTGTFNIGGPIVTAGGLVFIGATMDERFRAFDKFTGKQLWQYQLEAGAYSTPATYAIDGKQFVIVAGGGGGKPGTKAGNKYYAFSLPDNE